MYLINYIKSDGKEIILSCESEFDLRSILLKLADRLTIGTVLYFNVERLKWKIIPLLATKW